MSGGWRTSALGYGSATVRQRFTGQERDDDTTLDYFLARYYSGTQGRFGGPDPGNAGANPGDPQSWNGYAYVSGNPLTYTDPSGLQAGGGGDMAGGGGGDSGVPGAIIAALEFLGRGIADLGGGSKPDLSSVAWTPMPTWYVDVFAAPAPKAQTSAGTVPPKSQACISPEVFMYNQEMMGLFLSTKVWSAILGRTVSVGVGGTFGSGIGLAKFGIGATGSGSVALASDKTGNSAIIVGGQIQAPGVLETYPGTDGLALAANGGLQIGFSSQTISEMTKGLTIGASGSYGPVAVDANAHGFSVTIGDGFGARFGAGPTGSGSRAIPVCR